MRNSRWVVQRECGDAVVTEVTRYVVQVETGDTNDFEPINDVYVVLYGKRGDSGQRYLSKSKEGGTLFELFKVSTLANILYASDTSHTSGFFHCCLKECRSTCRLPFAFI